MPNLIELESRLCPNCDKSLDRWTLKVIVADGRLGVRCPACGSFTGLTMKGGGYDKATETEAAATAVMTNETSTILKEE